MDFKQKVMDYIGSNRRRKIDVPELSEEVYFTPITVLEMDKIITLAQGQHGAIHVWTIIEKLEDENGKKIFGPEDKPFVDQLDWKIVTDITGHIMTFSHIRDLKKTSEQTPSD